MKDLRKSALAFGVAGMLIAIAASPVAAQGSQLRLGAMFQDHAVLQRDRPVVVWGMAGAGDHITVDLNGATGSATADSVGAWRATLPSMPASGPYQLIARSDSGAAQTLSDVLVGDVFLCSGQSNMAFPVRQSLRADTEIAQSANDRIRLMTIGRDSSPAPLAEFRHPVSWSRATPETVAPFSAVCFFYARDLQRKVDVPIGLINASWGGSRIEPWISAAGYRSLGGYADSLALLDLYARDPALAFRKLGEAWQDWWLRATKGASRPWRPNAPGDWRAVPEPMRSWKDWGISETARLDGMIWFRRTVNLSAAQAASKDARVLLGAIDEIDQTWINGRPIGNSFGWGTDRAYGVPEGVLRSGLNTIVVNVLSTYDAGGMTGPAEKMALHLGGETVPLGGDWRYLLTPTGIGIGPQAPWESIVGQTTLYNAMIAPIGEYGIRAALWYQGESNAGVAGEYQSLLATLMADWRRQVGQMTPFLIVQLPNYGAAPTTPAASGWADLREAQRRVVEADRNAGLVVTIDIGDRDDLHPQNKQAVGSRLARAAMNVIYGSPEPLSGPKPLAARRDGGNVTVTFAKTSKGLVAYSAAGPMAVELCAETQASCRYAGAVIRNAEIVIASDGAPATRVRYCWGDGPVCNLYDTDGMPTGPFELSVQ